MHAHSVAGRGRPGALVGLGLFLLLGFIFPVMDRDELIFPNLGIFDEQDIEFEDLAFALYPAVAGIAITIVASAVRGPARGAVIASIGAAGYIVLTLMLEKLGRDRIGGFFGMIGPPEAWGYLLAAAGSACLIGGSRAKWHVPWSRAASILATIGGALAASWYVLPTLPADTLPIGQIFDLLDGDRSAPVGGVLLICAVLVIIAAILAMANWGRKGTAPAALGNASFWLVLSAYFVLYAGLWFILLDRVSDRREDVFLPVTLFSAKWALMGFGIVLACPLGIADLLVTSRPADAEEVESVRRRKEVPMATAVPEVDVPSRLKKLKGLYDDGLITEEEYESKRKRLMGEI